MNSQAAARSVAQLKSMHRITENHEELLLCKLLPRMLIQEELSQVGLDCPKQPLWRSSVALPSGAHEVQFCYALGPKWLPRPLLKPLNPAVALVIGAAPESALASPLAPSSRPRRRRVSSQLLVAPRLAQRHFAAFGVDLRGVLSVKSTAASLHLQLTM